MYVNGADSSVGRAYAQQAGGPGFKSCRVLLSGLRVRPFKVSGGNPRPPPEQAPGKRVKNLKERLTESKECVCIYIYIYIYMYLCI